MLSSMLVCRLFIVIAVFAPQLSGDASVPSAEKQLRQKLASSGISF